MPGQLFCLEDSYVRQCTAAVMSCSPVAVKKKGPKQWALQLSQTVLYAEGMHILIVSCTCFLLTCGIVMPAADSAAAFTASRASDCSVRYHSNTHNT